ncbi:MAG: mechanosensitive ion channel [Bacteroidales bacterium]|nr:mechanosensitive ion channel [Bacteroidales bacterium]
MRNIDFSNFGLYLLLFLSMALFFALRLISWLLPVIVPGEEQRKIVLRYKSLVELVVWIVFIIWAVQYLFYSNQSYAVALFALLFLLTVYSGWIGLKDVIAGAFLKAGHRLTLNEIIRVGEIGGKIIRFGHTSLVLETDSGETVFLPYSFLYGKVIIKSHPAESIHRHTFQIEIAKSESTRDVTERIRSFILTLPWISLKKDPHIRPLSETSTGQPIEITLFSIDKEHFQDMERLIKLKFADLGEKK